MADWRDQADERFKEKQVGSTFKLGEGDNCIRILPGVTKERKLGGAPFAEYLMHQKVGPDERFLRCGKDLKGEGTCWLCDVQIPKLKQAQEAAKRARAAILEPREQFAVQVAFVDDQQKWRGPLLWALAGGGSRALSTQVLGVLRSRKRDFISLTAGYNINIERTGTKMTDTRYGAIIPDVEPSPVPKHILQGMKPLEDLVPVYSDVEQQAAYFGREVEETQEYYDQDVVGDESGAVPPAEAEPGEGLLPEQEGPGEGGEGEQLEEVGAQELPGEVSEGEIADEFENIFGTPAEELPPPEQSTPRKPLAPPARPAPTRPVAPPPARTAPRPAVPPPKPVSKPAAPPAPKSATQVSQPRKPAPAVPPKR